MRASILDAAGEFIRSGESDAFTVDALAERAGMARRTIFNHFSSLDDVLTSACTRELAIVTEAFRHEVNATRSTDASADGIYGELARALRSVDLVPPIVFISRLLNFHTSRTQAERLAAEVFRSVGVSLRDEVLSGHPTADPLDVTLLTDTLLQGLAVIATVWLKESGAHISPLSRTRWDELLEYLVAQSWAGREHDDVAVRNDHHP